MVEMQSIPNRIKLLDDVGDCGRELVVKDRVIKVIVLEKLLEKVSKKSFELVDKVKEVNEEKL